MIQKTRKKLEEKVLLGRNRESLGSSSWKNSQGRKHPYFLLWSPTYRQFVLPLLSQPTLYRLLIVNFITSFGRAWETQLRALWLWWMSHGGKTTRKHAGSRSLHSVQSSLNRSEKTKQAISMLAWLRQVSHFYSQLPLWHFAALEHRMPPSLPIPTLFLPFTLFLLLQFIFQLSDFLFKLLSDLHFLSL